MTKFFNSQNQPSNIDTYSKPNKILGKVLLGTAHPKAEAKILGFLSRWAEEVTVVRNGRESVEIALAALDEGAPFDLVLVDTALPRLDAYSVSLLLRENDYPASIVSFSKDYLPIYDQLSEDAGCNGHILKADLERTLPGFFAWDRAANS